MFICLRKFATLIHFLFIFRMSTYRTFFDIWFSNPKTSRSDALLHYILQQHDDPPISEDVLKKLKKRICYINQKIQQKWTKSGRHRERFLNANCSWLEESISFADVLSESTIDMSLPGTSRQTGRPRKDFASTSERTKKRRVQHLLDTTSKEEISMATETLLRQSGKRDSAAIVKELCLFSPRRGTNIKKARKIMATQRTDGLSADQALALIIDANLSTHQYRLIRQRTQHINKNMYPSYYKIKQAKQLCYPEEMSFTETLAEIKLQSLMDHTIKRLLKAQEEVLQTISELKILNIVVKWGCDGAEQVRYKQKFSDVNSSDESLFSISMVPIQLYSLNNDIKQILWQNPATSSTKYCRPIKFLFAKESSALIVTEVNKVKEQAETLLPTKILINNMEILVKSTLIFCMIDGKICNAVASCASTQTCYICGAKPKEMNNETIILQKSKKKEFFSLGLSPLHSWIRLFECMLHISYRLEMKTWQVRGTENKNKLSLKKKDVQEKFRRELGILVDMPKQQAGNTNDGNTARIFFRNAEKSSEITGVNCNLIKRLHVILQCINSGFPINVDKFEEYVKLTRDLYIREYSWYPMPVSLHKILYHGKDIISNCLLPVGQLSEEAQEARNKHNKKFRELFTRKISRIDTNKDLMHRLLITSDPYLASLRAAPNTKRKEIPPEVCEILEMRISDTENSASLESLGHSHESDVDSSEESDGIYSDSDAD